MNRRFHGCGRDDCPDREHYKGPCGRCGQPRRKAIRRARWFGIRPRDWTPRGMIKRSRRG